MDDKTRRMIVIALADGSHPAKIAEAFEVTELRVRQIGSQEEQRRAIEMTERRKNKSGKGGFGGLVDYCGLRQDAIKPRAVVKGKEVDFAHATYADAINDHLKDNKNG